MMSNAGSRFTSTGPAGGRRLRIDRLVVIYSTTRGTAPDPSSGRSSTRSRRAPSHSSSVLSIDYRALAEGTCLGGMGCAWWAVAKAMFFGAVRPRRWIDLGTFNLQLSEFGRIVVALILASGFGENRRGARMTAISPSARSWSPFRFCSSCVNRTWGRRRRSCRYSSGLPRAGMRMRLLAVAALTGVLAPVGVASAGLSEGTDHDFVNPERDSRGAGYQQIQARVTVGSGGLTGKGSAGARRGSTSSCRSRTTTSFSRCWPKNGDSSASWRAGLYLFVVLRSFEAARLAKDRLGAYSSRASRAGLRFKSSTTSRCRPGWRP